MKRLLKSFTIAACAFGAIIAGLFAMIWFLDTYGLTGLSILFFSGFFLFLWFTIYGETSP